MEFLFIALMEKKKSDKSICHLFSRKAVKRSTIQLFPHQNKGFINFVFCRNWAVRNPVGTRLDSF